MKLAIIGGGSWGTALACVLAPRFDEVRLWFNEPELAARISETFVNDIFLPGIILPDRIRPESSLESALAGADFVLSVMPSHVVREVYGRMAPYLTPNMRIVSATKGLETDSLLRVSEVIASVTGGTSGGAMRVAALSGPTFAREVAGGKPTAVVVASADAELVEEVQGLFSGPTFRVYGSTDITGVEIAGSLKNVIAIGAGISDGLRLGHNAIAALITRGLAEMTRLAVALGGRAETLPGLAGLGDLVLTCTGDLSRNRQVGLQLAAGRKLGQIIGLRVDSPPMIAEGIKTTEVAMKLADRCGVDLPIAREMHAVLNLGRAPEEAIRNLMSRTLRREVG